MPFCRPWHLFDSILNSARRSIASTRRSHADDDGAVGNVAPFAPFWHLSVHLVRKRDRLDGFVAMGTRDQVSYAQIAVGQIHAIVESPHG